MNYFNKASKNFSTVCETFYSDQNLECFNMFKASKVNPINTIKFNLKIKQEYYNYTIYCNIMA